MSSVMKLSEVVDVVIGVDTHVATHCAAAVAAETGAVLGEITVAADAEGYAELVEFADQIAEQYAALRAWAIEGTASHGRGLAVHLSNLGQDGLGGNGGLGGGGLGGGGLGGNGGFGGNGGGELVIELDRPERARRRGGEKSDPLDAIRAAREAIARTRVGTPRGAGPDTVQAATRQSLATRLMARRSAVQGAGDARRQLFSLVLSAPEPVRARLRGMTSQAVIAKLLTLRAGSAWATTDVETAHTVACLQILARRVKDLTTEADLHEREINKLIKTWRPELLEEVGIGPIVAAVVLCAWGYQGRVHSEAAFAKLAGTSPIEANSGQTYARHRLNRYGDRRLNCALHTIAITRQRHDPATREYTERRTTQGKNPREIRRCLKRYIARDLYRILEAKTPRTGLDRT